MQFLALYCDTSSAHRTGSGRLNFLLHLLNLALQLVMASSCARLASGQRLLQMPVQAMLLLHLGPVAAVLLMARRMTLGNSGERASPDASVLTRSVLDEGLQGLPD